MKTAIQEMIERLEKSGFFLISYDYDIFNEALEKEKEQIIQAHIDGFDHIVVDFKKQEYAEQYYNQTYNQNES
jgi:hypothetical protein